MEESIRTSLNLVYDQILWVVPPPPSPRFRCLTMAKLTESPTQTRICFKEITDLTAAREIIGRDLVVELTDASPALRYLIQEEQLEEADATIDALGLEVSTDDGRLLGNVTEIIETGANPVWVVQGPLYGEVLLPVIDECVTEIDTAAGTATIHPMKGLLPDEN